MAFREWVRTVLHRLALQSLSLRLVDGNKVGRDVRGLRTSHLGGGNTVNHGVTLSGDVSLGFGSTIGVGCYIVGPVSIGRWCQIAPHAAVYGTNHPTTHVSTHVNPQLARGAVTAHADVRPVTIGNDVWIGHGALVLPGVKISDGAVVGGGSVVTRDVPEFSIVAGNPAVHVRDRFSAEAVGLIRELSWWDLSKSELDDLAGVFGADLTTDDGLEALRRTVRSRS